MGRSIQVILKNRFSSRPKAQQLSIIIEGKPRPNMSHFFLERGIEFKDDCYDKEQWLTACDKQGAFYCWSCLLFVEKAGTLWISDGFFDYEHLYESVKEHNSTVDHIGGLLKLQNFIYGNLTQVAPPNTPQTSENVKNKNFVERLLKFMCHGIFRTSFSPPDVKNFSAYILETCSDALNIFQIYEMKNFKVDLTRINWLEIVPGTLKTLSDIVKMVIKEEMKDCTHVSLIISEHSRGDTEVLISFVFRYLKGWEVRERFEGFYCVRDFELGKYVINVLEKYEIDKKILSFSYDGATASLEVLQSFILNMREIYGAAFVPCYSHSFEAVIERSISQIDGYCDYFFKSLRSMKSYIKSSSKIFNSFSILEQDITDSELNQGTFKFIRVLKKHRDKFIDFFKAVMTNHEEWTGDDVVKAMEFHRTLQNIRTVFLIEVFNILADLIVAISDILSSYSPEKIFGKSNYESCQKFLNSMKQNFPELWRRACSEIKNLHPGASDQLKDMRTKLQDNLFKIVDHLVCVMKTRIEPLENLNFFFLLNVENKGKLQLSEFARHCLGEKSFEVENELREVRQKYSSFNGMTVHNLLKYLTASNLQGNFENTYKVAKLILSMPCKPASLDWISAQENPGALSVVPENPTNQVNLNPKMSRKGFSKLVDIHSFSRGFSPYFIITSYWSILCIEKDIVSSLPTHEQFHSYLSTFKCIQETPPHELLMNCFQSHF